MKKRIGKISIVVLLLFVIALLAANVVLQPAKAVPRGSVRERLGNFTGPITGAAQDDNVKASLDLLNADTALIVADTAEIQQTNGVRTISKSLATVASGANNIFAVTGGSIKVTEWTIYIDTVMVATGCLIGGNVDPTVPATDTVFGTDGTALEFNNMAAGSLVLWSGVLAADFTAVTNGVGLSTNTAEGMIVPAGMIELTASASNAGALTVYMSYVALGEGVVVTAQ